MKYAKQFLPIERLCCVSKWLLESRGDRSCQAFKTFSYILQAAFNLVAIRSSSFG